MSGEGRRGRLGKFSARGAYDRHTAARSTRTLGVTVSGILTFPDDDNGAVLRNMQLSGDDLSEPRNVDFEHIFPSKESALAFAAAAMSKTDEVRISWYDEVRSWNVQVTRHMVPDHGAITSLETLLQGLARKHGGDSDGWGCLEVRSRRDA